jgi:hypothetical protein
VVRARENPLKNDCENANTHAHGDVHLVVLAHLQRRNCFGVSWTIGLTMEWDTALIHFALDQVTIWVVYPSELAFHRVQDHRKRSSDERVMDV